MECRKTRAGPYGTGSGKKSDKRFSLHCIIVAGIGATLLRRRTKKNAAFRSKGGADGGGLFPPCVSSPSGAGGIFRRAVSAFHRRNFAKPLKRRSFLYPRLAVFRRPLFLSAHRMRGMARAPDPGSPPADDNSNMIAAMLSRGGFARPSIPFNLRTMIVGAQRAPCSAVRVARYWAR
jgi:hypothetical protein